MKTISHWYNKKIPLWYILGEIMDYEKLLRIIAEKIDSLNKGDEFFLKDLFDGIEWKEFQTGERLSLGRRFKNSVLTEKIANVVYIGKAQNNSALYKKC